MLTISSQHNNVHFTVLQHNICEGLQCITFSFAVFFFSFRLLVSEEKGESYDFTMNSVIFDHWRIITCAPRIISNTFQAFYTFTSTLSLSPFDNRTLHFGADSHDINHWSSCFSILFAVGITQNISFCAKIGNTALVLCTKSFHMVLLHLIIKALEMLLFRVPSSVHYSKSHANTSVIINFGSIKTTHSIGLHIIPEFMKRKGIHAIIIRITRCSQWNEKKKWNSIKKSRSTGQHRVRSIKPNIHMTVYHFSRQNIGLSTR